MQSLLILMALDILSGLIAGFVTKALSSDVSWRGMAKKSLVLLLIAACEVLEYTWSLGVPLAAGVVGFYIVHELVSITENTGRAGLPMPKVLTTAIAKMRELVLQDAAGHVVDEMPRSPINRSSSKTSTEMISIIAAWLACLQRHARFVRTDSHAGVEVIVPGRELMSITWRSINGILAGNLNILMAMPNANCDLQT